jgi:hypothetical protein
MREKLDFSMVSLCLLIRSLVIAKINYSREFLSQVVLQKNLIPFYCSKNINTWFYFQSQYYFVLLQYKRFLYTQNYHC